MTLPGPLPREFFERPTLEVAPRLLGQVLVRRLGGKVIAGRIVEVEAYLGSEDRASHARRGLTPRTRPMFGPPGRAYVYLIYGMYHCLNVVTEPADSAAAILIRALEPIGELPAATNGPGRLCRALEIDLTLNECDLTSEGPLFIVAADRWLRGSIATSARIGVDYSGEWAARPWRFYLPESPCVSRPRGTTARPRSRPVTGGDS